MSQRTIGVTEVALRDAHQSLMATRMALEDMVDACADIDAAGYWSVECWGGATYDSCCLLYTSPSPRDGLLSRMPSSA